MKESFNDYIRYRIKRSSEIFNDAELLAKNDRWRSCVNRLYYSSFHLVNALLFIDGIIAKTHTGTKTKFLQNYIKTKKFNPDLGKIYQNLLDWREESDYAVMGEFQEEDIVPLIQEVKNFNNTLLKEIQSKIETK